MIYAIIPARGGSKRIPRKNLATLGGGPLIAWTIKAARDCPLIDRVYVSTEDRDVAAEARNHDECSVIARPPELATDSASSEVALLHAIETFNLFPEYIVFLQATSPFRDADDITRALLVFFEAKADSLFSAIPTGGGFVEDGAVYIFKTETFRKEGTRHCGKVAVMVMDKQKALEIDYPSDLYQARAQLEVMKCK